MAGLLFGFGPVERRSNSSVAIQSTPCSRASQRFARAIVGLGVQQTHCRDKSPRVYCFLLYHSSGTMHKMSLVPVYFQLLLGSQSHCIVVRGSVQLYPV